MEFPILVRWHLYINSAPWWRLMGPSTRPSLFQVMTHHLVGTNPLSNPMHTYHHSLERYEQPSVRLTPRRYVNKISCENVCKPLDIFPGLNVSTSLKHSHIEYCGFMTTVVIQHINYNDLHDQPSQW